MGPKGEREKPEVGDAFRFHPMSLVLHTFFRRFQWANGDPKQIAAAARATLTWGITQSHGAFDHQPDPARMA